MIIRTLKCKLSGEFCCNNENCKKLPNYISRNDFIKRGTVMLGIKMNAYDWCEYNYCRDCIDHVFNDIKMNMDSSLWVF